MGETWTSIDRKIIQNGFKKAGIIPFNNDVVPRNNFTPEALKRYEKELKSLPNAETIEATQDEPHCSFEDMLLETGRQRQLPEKTRKKKVGQGAEVITSEEDLQQLVNKTTPVAKKLGKKKTAPKRKKKVSIPSSSEEDGIDSPIYQESDNEEEFWEEVK